MSAAYEAQASAALEQLGLTTALAHLDSVAQQAAAGGWSYSHFLGYLLEAEISARHQQTVRLNLQFSRLPFIKRIEGFDFAAVIDVKNEERAIHGIVEGATEDQFASVAMLSRDAQMLFAEFGAARDVVVHGFINQGIVVHNLPLSDLRTIANGRSDPWEVFQDFDRVERWGAKRFCSGLVVNPDRVEDVFQGCQRIFGEGDFVNHVFIR